MSVYTQWNEAQQNRDIDALSALIHEDFQFLRHQSGTSMSKTEMLEMMKMMFGNDQVVTHQRSCLYENDEVMVEHILMDFPDGTRESILAFSRIQDGQLIHSQTGATPMKR